MTLVVPDVLEQTCTTRQALERLGSKCYVLLVSSTRPSTARTGPPTFADGSRHQSEGPHHPAALDGE